MAKMNSKSILVSLVLLALSAVWFSNAHSAVAVTGHYYRSGKMRESCRWSVPAQQFLKLPDAAKIELMKSCIVGIDIDGVIARDDGPDFVNLVSWFDTYSKRTNGGAPPVGLNSKGGSMVASIMIAKAIRSSSRMRNAGFTEVFPADECYSACVIVLAGGYRRHVAWGGRVGIHRPYFVEDEYVQLGYKDLKEAYDGIYDQLSVLFRQWNLSRSLVDDMFAVPSTEVRILTAEELSAYGLNKTDRVLVEQSNADTRTACGDKALAESGGEDANDSNWWASAKGQSCLKKINALSQARAIAKMKRLCGEAEVQAAEQGRGAVSQKCLDKYSQAD
jgi:hypothetical protein